MPTPTHFVRLEKPSSSSRRRNTLFILAGAIGALLFSPSESGANTANNYTGSATGNLLTGSNWSLGTVPTVSQDAVFTATTGIRLLNSGNLTVGSFNVTASTGTFSIRNENAGATNSTLTLGGAGNLGNSVAGTTAADLLYVATGATFNILGPNGSTGTGVLNVALGQTGAFNILGTSTISAAISGATFGITKSGAGTLTLSGANTYAGTTTVNAGTLTLSRQTGSLNSSSALTFGGTGTFNMDNTVATGALAQSLGALTFSAGDGSVRMTRTAAFDQMLTFASLAARPAGATGNFVNTGTNGAGNGFVFTVAPTASQLIDRGLFYNGSSYAAYDSGGFVRGLIYGTDTNTNASLTGTGVTTLGSTTATIDAQFVGSAAATTTASAQSAASTLTVANGAAFNVGQAISGTGITANTWVTAIAGNVLTLSVATGTVAANAVVTPYNSVSAQTTGEVNTLNLSGVGASLTLAAGQTLGVNGLLRSGGTSGVVGVISGGTAIQSATSGGELVIRNDAANDLLEIRSVIQNNTTASSLTKTGAGTLILSGVNTFSGATAVNGGILRFSKTATGAMNIGSAVSVASGATLQLLGASSTTTIVTAPLALIGNGVTNSLEFPSNNTQTYNVNGGVTLTNGAIIRSFGLINSYSFGAAFTGDASVYGLLFRAEGANTTNQAHTYILNAASNYTGNTTLQSTSQQANLRLGILNALPTTTVLNLLGTSADVDNIATLDLNGFSQTLAGLTGTAISASPIIGGSRVTNANAAAAATLTINNGVAATMAGNLGGTNATNFSLTKQNSGTFTVAGTNTYTGATTVSAGTLQSAKVVSLPGQTTLHKISIANGATLALNVGGAGEFTSTDLDNVLLNADFNATSALALDTSNVGAGFTYASTISDTTGVAGTLAITKLGTNTLTLSGPNTYTGATTLTAGTLSVGTIGDGGVASGNLGSATSAAANLVFGGGTLQYTGSTASTNRNFTINNAANATIDVSTAGTTLTMTGTAPTTTGILYKIGAGTLTLDPGAGSYSVGALSANGGTLILKSGTFATTGTDPFNTAFNVGAGARGGTLTIDGATLNVGGGKHLKVGASASGTLNILSGTVTSGDLAVGHNGTVVGTQSGGNVTVTNLYHQDTGSGTYTLTGGTLTAKRIFDQTTVANTFTLNLNGGTLKSAASTTNLIDNNGASSQVTVLLGTGNTIIDTTNSNATIVRPMDDMSGQAGTFTKAGTNTLTLTAANSYTGPTTVTGGTLEVSGSLGATSEMNVSGGSTLLLSASEVINNGAALVLGRAANNSGGTLKFNDTLTDATENLGALLLDFTSTIDFGNGMGGQSLLFAGLGAHTAGATLNIAGWNGNLAGGGAGDDRLLFNGSYTAFEAAYAQSDVSFSGLGSGYAAIDSGGTSYEIVPVPEPSSTALLGGAALLGLLGHRESRRRRNPRDRKA